MTLQETLGKRLIYLDGGMGTMLQAAGLRGGEVPEGWNLSHPEAVKAVHRAYLDAGCDIVTDTQMARAGINKTILASLGGEVHCFMSDADVAAEAKARGVTRAFVSMERAAALPKPCIFAIGNAPTALIRLCELIDAGEARPALVVGVPVGFVNVIESKERLARTAVPSIVAMGRKGGSAVASAILNALLYGITR